MKWEPTAVWVMCENGLDHTGDDGCAEAPRVDTVQSGIGSLGVVILPVLMFDPSTLTCIICPFYVRPDKQK